MFGDGSFRVSPAWQHGHGKNLGNDAAQAGTSENGVLEPLEHATIRMPKLHARLLLQIACPICPELGVQGYEID